MTSVSAALSGEQQRVVWIAWLTYAMFYLGRLNISPALPAIAESLDIGLGEVGLLGTVFFWCYALGQFINGQHIAKLPV
ncbi:MAG: MFS transporter, partial [Chloroflexota bacterium]